MSKIISRLALAAVAVLLLGSCSQINERLDKLESRIGGIENETIKSIDGQISAINQSIADLGSIRSSIQSLTQTAGSQDVDIESLQKADKALGERIDSLSAYVNGELVNYAKTEWVNATFSTLAQYEETCDTIAKIDARIGDLDTRLSVEIAAIVDSLNWINAQFGSYYTAAQMDAKLEVLQADIDLTDAENKAKADSIAAELTAAKAAVDSAKANIRAEYRAAIDTAITALDGKLSKALQDSIAAVNNRIDHLAGWVKAIDDAVYALMGRVDRLEKMIQSVVIVPAYSDESLAEVEGGILTIDCIITPASSATRLKKEDIKVLINSVKTKAVSLDTVKVSDIKILENGAITIFAQAPDKPSSGSLTAAVSVKDGANVDYTTNFHTFDYSEKNVKVVDFVSNNKVYIAPSDSADPDDVSGIISIKQDAAEHIAKNKPTSIEVKGIGTVTFNDKATNQIIENAEREGADSVFFKVEDVTETLANPIEDADVVIEVTMKTVDENGVEVFTEDNAGAGSEVTIQIPFVDEDVAFVKSVALVDASGDAIEGGVVEGSIDFDKEKHILTFKVNHFSMYAVDYLSQAEYRYPVTGVSLANDLKLAVGSSRTLTASFAPTNASVRDVIWSSGNTAVATVDKTGKVTGVAEGTATITVTTVDGHKTATCIVSVIVPEPYVEIAAKYDGNKVSTLRWYRQSLAITDSGKKAWKDGSGNAVKAPGTGDDVVVGDFFQWGTFAGFYGSGIDSDKGLLPYSSFTNKGCGDGSDAFTFKSGKKFDQANAPYWSGSAYTKYNSTDKKTTLDMSDDVASIILGGTWRMPESAEIAAMKAATYWAWDATDKGYYVYTPDPASDAGKVNNGTGTYDKFDALLFFPAAGYGDSTDLNNAGDGYYWSSSLSSDAIDSAYSLGFYLDYVIPQNNFYRCNGLSVRPVQDPDAKYVAVTNVSLDITSKQMPEGGSVQLQVTVIPEGATQKGIYWTSSDTTKVKVDNNGKVTGVASGNATITATTVDGSKTATCAVSVTSSKTMGKILETNPGIPQSENTTPPANAWVNSTNTEYKAFIGVDDNDKYFILKAGTVICEISMTDIFEKIDDSTYKRVEDDKTFIANMTGGKFISLQVESSNDAFKNLIGTYASPVALPDGALAGKFSVSATKKVHFSKGNLTYDVKASTNKWKFYEHQYDCATGYDANLISLFTWGYNATKSIVPDGNASDNVSRTSGNLEQTEDWGSQIGDGNTWRTLTTAEWQYLLDTRTVNGGTKEGKSYQRATINSDATSVYGLILYPDNYTSQTSATSYSSTEWAAMEAAGCVFLPAAGYRSLGSGVSYVGVSGGYWSSTAHDESNADSVYFISYGFYPDNFDFRNNGISVRLITESK